MNGASGPLSPDSTGGSVWSGVDKYTSSKSPDPSFPANTRGGGLVSPPMSSGPGGLSNGIPSPGGGGGAPGGYPPPDPMSRGGPGPGPGGPGGPPPDRRGNPSPPSSVTRSSDGIGPPPPGGPPNGPGSRPGGPGGPGPGPGSRQSEGRGRKGVIHEDMLMEHYAVLRRFLDRSLRDNKGQMRPNRAKDKLLRLSPIQFQELSTDVFDELLRRQSMAASQQPPNGPGPPPPAPPPYLLPKQNFHPKRNQARQKLSSLPPPRFRELATDVFFELERRYPRFAGMDSPSMRGGPRYGSPPINGMGPGGRPRGPAPRGMGPNGSLSPPGGFDPNGRPLPRTFQSNTIIPNKSTLVEDDDDQSFMDEDAASLYGYGDTSSLRSRRDTARSTMMSERGRKMNADYEAQIAQFQERVELLETSLQQKDEELGRMRESENSGQGVSESERHEWEQVRSELEHKVDEAHHLKDSLQSALDGLRADNSDLEREVDTLRQDQQTGGAGNEEWKNRYDDLYHDHQGAMAQLRDQQQATDHVRNEAAGFLEEMRALSEQDRTSWEKEEQLTSRVSQLEKEASEWKNRYARAKTQLRNIRASSTGMVMSPAEDARKHAQNSGLMHPEGLIRDIHLTKFQLAVDELLHGARGPEPMIALDYIQPVVLAVRELSADVTNATGAADKRGKKLTARVSSTANNLITATKNFAASKGISPISLLDAAASHLSSAVVDLIKTYKLRPTPVEELEQDEQTLSSDTYRAPVRAGKVASGSVYSPVHSRGGSGARDSYRQGGGMTNGAVRPGFGLREQDSDIEELKYFLENQTESLVRSIQALVGAIRSDGGYNAVRTHIGDISSVVHAVVDNTESTVEDTHDEAFRSLTEPVVNKLAECRARLLQTAHDAENASTQSAGKEVVNSLPPLAFEIARETKELVQRIDTYGEDEDSFR